MTGGIFDLGWSSDNLYVMYYIFVTNPAAVGWQWERSKPISLIIMKVILARGWAFI